MYLCKLSHFLSSGRGHVEPLELESDRTFMCCLLVVGCAEKHPDVKRPSCQNAFSSPGEAKKKLLKDRRFV